MRRGIPARKQGDLVSLPHELFGEIRNDALGAAILLRRNAFSERCDLRDFHWMTSLGWKTSGSKPARAPWCLAMRGHSLQSGKTSLTLPQSGLKIFPSAIVVAATFLPLLHLTTLHARVNGAPLELFQGERHEFRAIHRAHCFSPSNTSEAASRSTRQRSNARSAMTCACRVGKISRADRRTCRRAHGNLRGLRHRSVHDDARHADRESAGHFAGRSNERGARARAIPQAAQIVAAECVVLAETKDHLDWESARRGREDAERRRARSGAGGVREDRG